MQLHSLRLFVAVAGRVRGQPDGLEVRSNIPTAGV